MFELHRHIVISHGVRDSSVFFICRAHRVDVRPTNNRAGKSPDPIDVVATTEQYEHSIENMSFSTTYEIRVSTYERCVQVNFVSRELF